MANLQLWFSTLEIGSFFALMGLAFLLVRMGTNFFNIALGPYAMVAALGSSWLIIYGGAGLWGAVLLSVGLAVVLAAVTELGVVRVIQQRTGHDELPALVSVVAVLFVVQQLAGVLFGRAPLPGHALVDAEPIRVAGGVLPANSALLIGVTAAIFISVTLWMRLTGTGRLLRAIGDNKDAAEILGLPVRRIRLITFVLSGFIAGVAGILFATKNGVSFESGLQWTLMGFLTFVIGGAGRVWAPLVGGLLLGMAQVFTPYYFTQLSPQIVIFLIAVLFFAFKPEGLFVRKVRV